MIFNSLTYLLLLLFVVLFYWFLPFKARLILIFSSSLIFYGFWKIKFIPILLISVIVDWFVAQKMMSSTKHNKFFLLLVSLTTNLGLLFYFKYLIFFSENTIGFANMLGADISPLTLKIILPLGISFYTFQTISYTVDVYRGFIKPEKNFILFSCYVTFFPQLVAGPILRATEVLPQFCNRPLFSFDFILVGMRLILFGLFLKVVLADNLSILVDSGFIIDIQNMSAIDVWTLAFLFGFQIYFDFSAYSFIALGSARMLGITFPNNFNFPYISTSPKEFWQRWHISLSSWIRDYLYLPLNKVKVFDRSLGGLSNMVKSRGDYKSLFLTMGIMGLWHGANWTFLIWGIYHALIISIYRLIQPFLTKLPNNLRSFLGISITLPVIMLSWIPFRANSLSDAIDMWKKILSPTEYTWLGMRENVYLITFLVLIGFYIVYLFKLKILPIIKKKKNIFVIFDLILIMFVTSLVIIFFRSINQFIYFQF
jgi:D-alanyl-lipoteichoic acid acyltransferase DltB (MBOAT superfamily)